MRTTRKGAIWLPLMVIIMLASAFGFSRHLDKEVENYAKKRRERYGAIKEMPSLQWDREFDIRLGKPFRGKWRS